MAEDPRDWEIETRAVRGGLARTEHGEISEALFLNQSFAYESAQAADDRFAGNAPGFIYQRFGNPTTSFTGSVTMSLVPGSGNRSGDLSGTLTRSAIGGAATFNDLEIDEEGKGYRLRATAGSVTSDSQPFTVR